VAQVFNLPLQKSTLGRLGKQFVRAKKKKDSAQVIQMFLQSAAVHQNIIKKHNDELTCEFRKYGVHKALEGSRCVRQSERHNSEMEVAMMRLKRCLLLIGFSHADLMIPRPQIQF
jgi:hypothetical protein